MTIRSFKDLKKSSRSLDKLQKEAEKAMGKKDYSDPREWRPTKDKMGEAVAEFRFLPGSQYSDDEGMNFLKIVKHSFRGKSGKWVDVVCPSTFGKKCPICDDVRQYWDDSAKKYSPEGNERKRKTSFWYNIYMVNDHGNPENNGKVFLYRSGVKIFGMINEKINPDVKLGEERIDIFDMEEGANFLLRVTKVGDFDNYDKSKFKNKSAISTDDEELQAIWGSTYSLTALLEEQNPHRTFEELEEILEEADGEAKGSTTAEARMNSGETKTLSDSIFDDEDDVPVIKEEKPKFNPQSNKQATETKASVAEIEPDDDFGDIDFDSLMGDD